MRRLEWQDRFSVGVPEVDHEHRELIRLINNLHEAVAQSQPVETVLSALGAIHAAISAHFALEEKNMVGATPVIRSKRDHDGCWTIGDL
jgi:hemerythrin